MALTPLLPSETGSNGDSMTTTNSGASSIVVTGGTATVSTTYPAFGTRAMKFTGTSTSGGCYAQYAIGSTVTAFNIREQFYIETLPSADTTVFWIGLGSTRGLAVELTSTGAIRVRDSANAAKWNGVVTTSTGTFSSATQVRFELYATAGAGTGTFRLVGYSKTGTSALTNLDSGTMTSQSLGTGFDTFRVGSKTSTGSTTSAIHIDLDASAYDPAATGLPGPYSVTLDTPVVTLGTTTDPSTVGGSDGSQVVTWAAISGATSYDAYIATESTPDQGEFSLHDDNVTSPYTFTGLSEGVYAFGIQAKE